MINKHNYQEYFLMFTDGELSPSERDEVLKFLHSFPELKEEFEEIKQAKLFPEKIIFDNKDALMRSARKVNLTNYTSYFLSAIDNELSNEEITEVRGFLDSNPQYEREFQMLKQTILPAETIHYPDKTSLLRHEKIRTIPAFLKIAAAASVFAISFFTWNLLQPVDQDVTTVASNNIIASSKPAATKVAGDHAEASSVTTSRSRLNDSPKQEAKIAISKSHAILVEPAEAVSKSKIAPVEPSKAASETLPVDTKEISPHPDDLIAANRPVKKSEVEDKSDNTDAGLNMPDQPLPVYTASYKVVNTTTEADESLYVGAIEINKNKVRGLLKKIGGAFVARQEEEASSSEIRIANFQIQKNQ